MPIREYTCKSCGEATDELFDNEYPDAIDCKCGEKAEYRFSRFAFAFDFWEGFDPGAGQHFGTARNRDTFLDKNNLEKVPDGAYDTSFTGKRDHG